MSELAKRVAVAAVGIPVVLSLVLLGGWFLTVPVAVFAGLGAMELYRFGAAVGTQPLNLIGAIGAGALVMLAGWQSTFTGFAPWGVAALGALTAISIVSAISLRGPDQRPLASVGTTLLGVLYVGLSLAVVPLLRDLPGQRGWVLESGDSWSGLIVLALPLAATWIGDASAFFVGSALGGSKLAPTISPNKSWVGFWAALVGAGAAGGLWFVVAGSRLPGFSPGLAASVGIGTALGLGAVTGDLAESLFKREARVKDSGALFPGHGGVLDRLDALIYTLPLAYVALALFGGGG